MHLHVKAGRPKQQLLRFSGKASSIPRDDSQDSNANIDDDALPGAAQFSNPSSKTNNRRFGEGSVQVSMKRCILDGQNQCAPAQAAASRDAAHFQNKVKSEHLAEN